MFDAIGNIAIGYVLCGIIWAGVIGASVGNFACSLVYRLPRGKLLLDKTPYCGSCGHLLETRDLFPIISAVILKHRCRYCGAKFPTSHTWTEILCAVLFVLTFFEYNFSERFICIIFIGTFLITLASIQANDGIIMRVILVCLAVSGMVYRTLADHTLYGFTVGAFVGLAIGMGLCWHKVEKVGHVYRVPEFAQLIALGGLIVGIDGLPAFLVLFALFYVLTRLCQWVITVPFSLAVILPVLYPASFALPILAYHN